MKKEYKISKEKKAELLHLLISKATAEGKEVEITFIKADGSVREMKAKNDIGPVSGKGLKWDPRKQGMRPMFDTNKNDWRMANLHTTSYFKVDDDEYTFL